MIRYLYNGDKYLSLYEIRQKIFEDTRIAFGDWNEDLKRRFGVSEEEYNPEDEMTDEQLAERRRYERDTKLRSTDKYLLPDFPGVTPEALEAIKAYREALRNVPEQEGFPRQINWPEIPVFMGAKEKGNAE